MVKPHPVWKVGDRVISRSGPKAKVWIVESIEHTLLRDDQLLKVIAEETTPHGIRVRTFRGENVKAAAPA